MALEISDFYKKVCEEKDFQSLLSHSPWPHFVLDNFIRPQDFKRVQQRVLETAKSFYVAEDHPAKLQMSYLEDFELAEFLMSRQVKNLFENIAGSALYPNPELAIHVRKMTPASPAFPPHVDLIVKPSLVALYYISPEWSEGCGGELVLLENEQSDFDHTSTKWIAPVENRLVLFMTDSNYWHAVRKVSNWQRFTILTEWIQKNERNDVVRNS